MSTLTRRLDLAENRTAVVDPLIANLTHRAETTDAQLRNLSAAVDRERTDLDAVLRDIFSALSNPPSTGPTAIPTAGPSVPPSTSLPSGSPSLSPAGSLAFLGHLSMGNLYQQRSALAQHNAACRSRCGPTALLLRCLAALRGRACCTGAPVAAPTCPATTGMCA